MSDNGRNEQISASSPTKSTKTQKRHLWFGDFVGLVKALSWPLLAAFVIFRFGDAIEQGISGFTKVSVLGVEVERAIASSDLSEDQLATVRSLSNSEIASLLNDFISTRLSICGGERVLVQHSGLIEAGLVEVRDIPCAENDFSIFPTQAGLQLSDALFELIQSALDHSNKGADQ